jgi:hypothetical protein
MRSWQNLPFFLQAGGKTITLNDLEQHILA